MLSRAKKYHWQIILIVLGGIFVLVFAFAVNLLIYSVVKEDENKVTLWASTIQKKAELVDYTREFFQKVEEEEKKRVEIWAEATKRLIYSDDREDLSFYIYIISRNTTIPVVLTDENLKIIAVKNVDFSPDTVHNLTGKLYQEFSHNPPIEINYKSIRNYLFYKESILFHELKKMLEDLIGNFLSEIVRNSLQVPVVILDSTKTRVVAKGNLPPNYDTDSIKLWKFINQLKSENTYLKIKLKDGTTHYVYYQSSPWVKNIKWSLYLLVAILIFMILLIFIYYSTFKREERHRIWLGMTKETAHQLGTPLSSLEAKVEMLEIEGVKSPYIQEIKQDLMKLRGVLDRFDKIGTKPQLEKMNILPLIQEVITYIQKRSPSKIRFHFQINDVMEAYAKINRQLFMWVMENVLKNAVDALVSEGDIIIRVFKERKRIIIDVEDNGKGIPRAYFKRIFEPGFTTKKGTVRGMGLALAKRIIEEDHHGKIFIHSSTLGKGTIVRIILQTEG
ncbi:MAG: HAMP domain-containing histidine kinase [Bacteroidales bacterium]|nr:HAMP domain-containing histidine kinase [Bacteroidales bacterium]